MTLLSDYGIYTVDAFRGVGRYFGKTSGDNDVIGYGAAAAYELSAFAVAFRGHRAGVDY